MSDIATSAKEAYPTKAAADREPISAFIICFNEEDHIADCIESVQFCDEIVVVDSFSTDRTVEIAKQCGATVIQRKWTGYRDQKAFGLDAVHNEWVLNIDADERVSPELRDNVLAILRKAKKQSTDEVNGYYMNRVVYYLGRWWRQGGWYPEYRLRLLRKSKTTWGGVDPHEKPIVEGPTERIDGELQHYTYESLQDQLERLQRFSTLAAEEEYSRGKRASIASLVFNPLMRFFKFYLLKRGYREGIAGLIVAVAESYYTFMKYAKLWEQEFNEKNSKERGDS